MMNKGQAGIIGSVIIVALLAITGFSGYILYTDTPEANPSPGQDACLSIEGCGDDPVNSGGGGSSDEPADDPDPVSVSSDLNELMNAHVQYFGRADGSFISDKGLLSTNPCIAQGETISSESMGRVMKVFVETGDKTSFDRSWNWVQENMIHPEYGWMMWKLEADGTAGSCGGFKSAVDSEMIAIGALLDAGDRWGQAYYDDAQTLMDVMYKGVFDGKYIPYCLQPDGREADGIGPCVREVYLGYIPLEILHRMASIDNKWEPVYQAHLSLSKGAVQQQGMYGAWVADGNYYVWKEAWIHTNWALKHCAEIPECRPSVQHLIDANTVLYKEQNRKLCQEFFPPEGCKISNPPYDVYGHWAEIYCGHDAEMCQEMLYELHSKWLYAPQGVENPLIHKDHFSSISIIEGIVEAEAEGAVFTAR